MDLVDHAGELDGARGLREGLTGVRVDLELRGALVVHVLGVVAHRAVVGPLARLTAVEAEILVADVALRGVRDEAPRDRGAAADAA